MRNKYRTFACDLSISLITNTLPESSSQKLTLIFTLIFTLIVNESIMVKIKVKIRGRF